jgi:hypothetical protein
MMVVGDIQATLGADHRRHRVVFHEAALIARAQGGQVLLLVPHDGESDSELRGMQFFQGGFLNLWHWIISDGSLAAAVLKNINAFPEVVFDLPGRRLELQALYLQGIVGGIHECSPTRRIQ